MSTVEFSRWFLAIFFSGVATFYTTAILRKKRRTGVSPVIHGKRGSLHYWIHYTFVAFRAIILLVCVARVPFPGIDVWLLPIRALWHPGIIVFGNTLMLASFVLIVVMHNGMGNDWRSGIDDNGPHRLINTGAFAISRNPMFLCIQAAQAGFFLSLPSAFTLLCLFVGAWAIHAQVRLEERHLEARLGDAYRHYKARVPRWLKVFR